MSELTKPQKKARDLFIKLGNKQAVANKLGKSRSTIRDLLSVVERKGEAPWLPEAEKVKHKKGKGDRVLVIGDCHAPCMLKGYVPFLQEIYKKHDCNRVVHIGDMVDWASISYHPKAPSLKNSEAEYAKAYKQVQTLYAAFPELDILIGNHDALSERQASDVGLPVCVLKDFNQLWNVPKWNVIDRFDHIEIDGVLYQHGDRGRGGQINAAFLNALDSHQSVVQGHFHAQAGVLFFANHATRIFGLQVGCGCDSHALAMAYGKKFNKKPIVGCGVVIEGRTGIWEPMEL
jgi:predicted phosphodiesterase